MAQFVGGELGEYLLAEGHTNDWITCGFVIILVNLDTVIRFKTLTCYNASVAGAFRFQRGKFAAAPGFHYLVAIAGICFSPVSHECSDIFSFVNFIWREYLLNRLNEFPLSVQAEFDYFRDVILRQQQVLEIGVAFIQ